MIILGRGTDESIEVTTSDTMFARISIEDSDGDAAAIFVDSNHLQALEAAVRAARLELDARAISP